jgi:hypothetical protein
VSDLLGEFIVRTLLRYFRAGATVLVEGGSARYADRDLLLLHWAVSPVIADLARHLREHPHEVHAALERRVVTATGEVRGRIDAAATAVLQARTADPSTFIFEEPFRSHVTGPNRVLAWTMDYATQLARRFRQMLPENANYRLRAVATLRLVEEVRRMLPRLEPADLTVPSADDVRASRASRLLLYRKAAAAYDFLRALERLDPAAIETLLSATLVGPTERWRQFELALAVAMAEAVAERLGLESCLRVVLPGAADVLIVVGPYAIRWQKAGPTFQRPHLGRWEEHEVAILSDYGVSAGYDRPDVVLYEIASGRTIAVGEAKYFESDEWVDRLRDAVGQVVTYARGYEASQGDADAIIARSVVALWSAGGGQAPAATSRAPFVATFADLRAGLDAWAARALAGSRSAPPFSGSGSPSSSVASVAGG